MTGEESTTPLEDLVIGALASSISVCLMIPLDTIKVRMTTLNAGGIAYLGISDCVKRMLKEEGVYAFYRGLPPRLVSVVPMSCLQFAVYEDLKRQLPKLHWPNSSQNRHGVPLSKQDDDDQRKNKNLQPTKDDASFSKTYSSTIFPPAILQSRLLSRWRTQCTSCDHGANSLSSSSMLVV
eukprot:CAMPEP_0197297958 /NCGR_PEP_ID=MMETSP0890-20130614/42370_1 /TAXON_ID=44058 ORGANISM="Aureoumbra lagunensis, Strain CCMP1510" /NCGR_SAMPLE_ID=MMETSP0890 /ASSEMBLY_ACC=CAM_ASM_000533 /LENGTH=179 /DNA_ID=CAMNT_0042775389 /DNA_START=537 /DNA_END=1076 /DNA_ORIENTATION=+